ncbi:MAG: hypothetical protein HY075_01660 [Deltaproteobacteria bacterium]|nr:hypothetical protein [Deltaproteobacteria bacterium]
MIGTVTEDDGQVTTTVGVGGVYYKDVEPWFAVRGTYQRLFASLLTRGAPKDPAPVIERKIVLLTGDVHRGSTTSLRYFAKKPLDWDGAPGKFRAIFAHFVSSPFKNEDNNTRMAHNRAHFAGPSANPPDATNLSGDEAIEYDYYGVATGAYISSGNPSGVLRPTVIQVSPDIRARTVYGETTSPKDELLGALNNDPEWAYRVNYIYSDGLNKGVGGTPLLVGTPAGGSGTSSTGLWTDKDDLQFLAFSTALGQQHQQIQEFEIKGKMKVGVNHIGEIYFEDRTTSAGVKLPHVTQTLHWRVAPELQLESLNVARMTTYPVEFDLLWNSKRAPPFFKGLT